MANAHRSRHGNQPGCIFCKYGPKEARALKLYRNKNGHRRNPTRKRRRRNRRAL